MEDLGKLIMCPTPLGNLGDVSMRTIEALKSADVVLAEDTRVTGKLLSAYDIHKRLERLDEAMIGARTDEVLNRVRAGEVLAFCSDAGMPGVSDPGLRLVHAAREAHLPVEVLPGPTAVATAYLASGTENTSFYFGGFFPRKQNDRLALLDSLKNLDAALIFYESPYRLVDTLLVLSGQFATREASVCRELTKMHEEILRAPLPQLYDFCKKREEEGSIKGEIVIVVDGPTLREEENQHIQASAAAMKKAYELVQEGMRTKDIVTTLTNEFGLTRNEAYALAVSAVKDPRP
ncbi:MAG: 16S rRNA (cytidine(1402)-2'-O)-methyltransferase [Eggerthellaceae bacterium]